jgi:alpha-aminoadipic semialdehyde synthase
MQALDHILENNIRLIDYEKICDAEGKRLVAFGRFAGLAGMIDFLSGLGIFLFQRSIPTSFINVDMSYKYFNLQEAFTDL